MPTDNRQTAAPRITPGHIESVIEKEYFHIVPGTTLTLCVLTWKTGSK